MPPHPSPRHYLLFLALLHTTLPVAKAADAGAGDQAPTSVQQEVVVTGGRLSDTEERRYSTAAKMVFGREELDRYGDTSLADVLKRLPGITIAGTPGRGGDIRMRGLGNGYTMIMINGEPAPRGFSMDSLTPEQVERIEIMRAPVAEHSTRAIAGIVNIVLRSDFVRKENEARPGFTWEQGKFQPSLSLRRADRVDNLNYNVTANLFHRDYSSDAQTTTNALDLASGTPTLSQVEHDKSHTVSDGLHLTSSFNWKLGGGDSLSLRLSHYSNAMIKEPNPGLTMLQLTYSYRR